MSHEEFEGIAALDALGVASAGDAAALRAHAGGCIPCRRARNDFGEAVTLLARGLEPVPPPAALRDRIAASLDPSPAHNPRWWLATAATLFLVLWGWRELEMRAARGREASQRAELARLEHENTRLAAEIAALASAGTRTIALSGQEVAPAASAKVFLEPDRRRAIVFFHDLPANPGDKSYQLWIIRADQPKPMSAGVFDVSHSGKASIAIENLPVATEIKALAVTLEPKGGAQEPTNTRFYVAGNT
jgi:hypothetical protein